MRLAVFLTLFSLSAVPQCWAAEKGKVAQPLPGWEETIRRALDKPISFEFMETSLDEVMAVVEKQAGIPNVLIDVRALDDVGIGADTPITRHLKGISLRSALRLLLRDLDLTYVLRDGALVITTPEEAEGRLTTEVFQVLDLIRPYSDTPPDEYDYDTLIQLITSVIQPTTWADVGGPGAIDGYRGTLVVSQTQDVLDEIPQLLDTLRKARQIVREHGMSIPPVASLSISPPDNKKYQEALDRKGSCEFFEKPLCDVVEFLESTWKIEVELDVRALDDVGLGTDLPITFSAKDLTLRQTLRHILNQLDLTFVLRDEVLLITTPEESEMSLETRVYPVGDLVSGVLSSPQHDSVSFQQADYESLIDGTTATVAPTTWDQVGGPGAIEAAPAFGLLVVSQTGHVHREIEDLFAKLRAKIPAKEMAAQQVDHSGLRLVVYFVTTKSVIDAMKPVKPANTGKDQSSLKRDGPTLAQMGGFGGGGAPAPMAYFEDQELLELIKELVEPASWSAKGVYASAAPGRLVIRQTDQIHRKIRRMLTQLGVHFTRRSVRPAIRWRHGYGRHGLRGRLQLFLKARNRLRMVGVHSLVHSHLVL